MPNVVVTGKVGNRGDFEVTVNEELVFSKQQAGAFPDPVAVVAVVQEVHGGGSPKKVTATVWSCILL